MANDPRAQHFVECMKCNRNAEYHCNTCREDLCVECKIKHQTSSASKDHDVVIYTEKKSSKLTSELCPHHSLPPYRFCTQCGVPVCQKCIKENHNNHNFIDSAVIFDSKNKNVYDDKMFKIRDRILPMCRILLGEVREDSIKCRQGIKKLQMAMTLKAQTLKDMVDKVLAYNTNLLNKIENSIISELQQQENVLSSHISDLQNILDEYERNFSINEQADFTLFQKVNQIKDIPHLNQVQLPSFKENQSVLSYANISKLFGEITESVNPVVMRKSEIPSATKIMSFTVPDIKFSNHISPVTTNRVWVSDNYGNLVLTNLNGEKLNEMKYPERSWGCHTLSATEEFISIFENTNILYKITTDNKKLPCIELRCGTATSIYSSPLNGDILVGMLYGEGAIVIRFKSNGQEEHRIQFRKEDKPLYKIPSYVTENRNNGDVCVSDVGKDVVVVVDRFKRYRFKYKGHPSKSNFLPQGIGTDTRGHILVSDYSTDTIHMIDKNGYFISFLLSKSQGISGPSGLNVDVKNNLLWVGDNDKNTVSVYSYYQH